MRIIRQKSLRIVRDEKTTVPELEQAVTDLEIENYQKDAAITELEDTIAEDEQAITDLEIEVAKLKGEM